MGRPHRHNRINYIGRHTFLVTAVTLNRVKAFSDNEFAGRAIAALFEQARKHQFAIPAFTYMPDHSHVVATGLSAVSDLERFVSAWKQATGFEWHKVSGGRLWQEGYWDQRLRAGGSIGKFVEYVIQNPVRARIVDDPSAYPLTGSSLYSMEQMLGMTSGTNAIAGGTDDIPSVISASGGGGSGSGGTGRH